MNYQIKVFSGELPDKTQERVNRWLKENDVEVIAVIPAVSISALALPRAVISPTPGGQQLPSLGMPPGTIGMQVEVQQLQAFIITVVYKDTKG